MAKGYPDWHRGSLMQGLRDGIPTGINMDDAGNLIALLKGLYGTTPTGLQCDVDGNIKIDLNVQSATRLDVRQIPILTKYASYYANVNSGSDTTIINLTGPGRTILCPIHVFGEGNCNSSYFTVNIDGEEHALENFNDSAHGGISANDIYFFKCIVYDDVNIEYLFCMEAHFDFLTTFKVKFHNASSSQVGVSVKCWYQDL